MASGAKRATTKSKSKGLPTGQKTLVDLFKNPEPPAPPPATVDAPSVVETLPAPDSVTVVDDDDIIEQPTTQPLSQPKPPLVAKLTYSIFAKRKPASEPQEIIDITNDEPPVAGSSRLQPTRATRSQFSKQLGGAVEPPNPKLRPTTPPRANFNGSRSAPIVLDSSPGNLVTDTPMRLVIKPSGYARAATPQVLTRGMTPLRLKAAKEMEMHHPTRESQHVRGSQSQYTTPSLPFPRRSRPTSLTETSGKPVDFLRSQEDPMDCLNRFLNPIPLEINSSGHKGVIPLEYLRSSPVLSRVLVDPPPQQLWTDKYRPTRAIDVIGAEQHSLYLRDWMHALELQQQVSSNNPVETKNRGVKRPRVIRTVDKVRKKARKDDYEGDWVAHDDDDEEEEEGEPWDEDNDVSLCQRTLAELKAEDPVESPRTIPFERHDFDESLSNTILLAGPSGSCKTAAVYACAQEMDWDIFEVYPGIGKRSGVAIDNLVGDVGKNHLVRKTQLRKGMNAFVALLSKGKEVDDVMSTSEAVAEDPLAREASAPPQVPSGIRQSLILIEECDILYKEDANFWPAIIKLIKECKRPVVLTCNDISLVPREELPLQATLGFGPCPSPLAALYMQTICLAEGLNVDRQKLLDLYQSPHLLDEIDMPSTPVNPRTESVSKHDLRRAIHNLQLLVAPSSLTIPTTPVLPPRTEADASMELMRAVKHTELLSSWDANCERGSLLKPEAISWSASTPSSDDLKGHTSLHGPFGTSQLYESWGHTTADYSMGRDLARVSTYSLAESLPRDDLLDSRVLFAAMQHYQSRMLPMLLPLIPIDAPLMPSSSVYVDYEPYIRHMVRLDDLYSAPKEGLTTSFGSRPTRTTRSNPQWTRMISFDTQELLDDYRSLAL